MTGGVVTGGTGVVGHGVGHGRCDGRVHVDDGFGYPPRTECHRGQSSHGFCTHSNTRPFLVIVAPTVVHRVSGGPPLLPPVAPAAAVYSTATTRVTARTTLATNGAARRARRHRDL